MTRRTWCGDGSRQAPDCELKPNAKTDEPKTPRPAINGVERIGSDGSYSLNVQLRAAAATVHELRERHMSLVASGRGLWMLITAGCSILVLVVR